jgi:hypothetical protein
MRVKQSLPLVLVQYDSLILSVIAFKVQAGCSLDPNFRGSATVESYAVLFLNIVCDIYIV